MQATFWLIDSGDLESIMYTIDSIQNDKVPSDDINIH